MTETASKPETTPSARRGFPDVRCPLCGATDPQKMQLDDLATFWCPACEEEYGLDDVRNLLASWQIVPDGYLV
jgi:uncharacterized protein (DUF983 family)